MALIGNLKGTTGATGAQGPTGPTGAAGSPGSVWYNGSGVPLDTLGVDGDYYLRNTTGDVYQKVGGTWA